MSAFDTYSVDSDHHQNHADEDNFSGYGGYSNFSGGNVSVVDHTSPSASPDIFRFSDLDPSYSQSPFELVHVAENGNDNGYHDDSVFVSDKPVLPAPTEMESEECYALQEKEAVEEEAETSRRENGGSIMLMAMVVARNESGGRDAEFGIEEEKMGNKIIN
ncbi:hypothetical protein S83_021231 [Arachis hypogaea]